MGYLLASFERTSAIGRSSAAPSAKNPAEAGLKVEVSSIRLLWLCSWCRAVDGGVRIAQIPPLAESVPPKLYGGTERVVSWLTEELIALGHEVTLLASGDSVTRGRLVPIIPRAICLSGRGRVLSSLCGPAQRGRQGRRGI